MDMCKWLALWFCVLLNFSSGSGSDTDVQISNSDCTKELYIGEGDSVMLRYDGRNLDYTCQITLTRVHASDFIDKLCVSPQTFKIDKYGIEVSYYERYYRYSDYDERFTQSSAPYTSWCADTDVDSIIITFESGGSSNIGDADIVLKIYIENDEFSEQILDAAKTVVYIIVGVVVSVVVIVIILIVVVVICCCKRQGNTAGTVYRAPVQAGTTPGAYPMTYPAAQPMYQPQAGYQPPAAGYQPPAAGYQPAYPGGAQPMYQPQAGYQPAAQQDMTGYQQQGLEKTAPPADMQPSGVPPPYSQN